MQKIGEEVTQEGLPLPVLVGEEKRAVSLADHVMGVFCLMAGAFVGLLVGVMALLPGPDKRWDAVLFVGLVALAMLKSGWDYCTGRIARSRKPKAGKVKK